MATQQKEAPVRKTYFSRHGSLTLHASAGKMVTVGREVKRIGEKFVEFRPLGTGDSAWGMFQTDDPEIIAFLDNRIEEARAAGATPDIMDPEDFKRATVPLDQQIAEKDRTITRLKADLDAALAQIRGKK
jgi:hypothetical protein